MEIDKMLCEVIEQEKRLRFSRLDLDTIYAVCDEAWRQLSDMGASCYIRACVGGCVVYSRCMPGASRNNEEWARRKGALCERYWRSSLHTVLAMTSQGKTLEEAGLSSVDYGFSGGSFPILLESGICVGSITVSGLSGEEDHAVVVAALGKVLGR